MLSVPGMVILSSFELISPYQPNQSTYPQMLIKNSNVARGIISIRGNKNISQRLGTIASWGHMTLTVTQVTVFLRF